MSTARDIGDQTFTTPILGTPASGTATNITGLPPAGVVGTAAILGANTFTGKQTGSTLATDTNDYVQLSMAQATALYF